MTKKLNVEEKEVMNSFFAQAYGEQLKNNGHSEEEIEELITDFLEGYERDESDDM
jgi:hypothetical protein